MLRWRRLVAFFLLVVGIVLSPLRAVAATVPTLFAYDAAVRPTPTTMRVRFEAVQSEAGQPRVNAYDDALLRYDYRFSATPGKFIPGALRWDVPGGFRGAGGTWELVYDPNTNTIVHFLFR